MPSEFRLTTPPETVLKKYIFLSSIHFINKSLPNMSDKCGIICNFKIVSVSQTNKGQYFLLYK
jgi:hypothetical protein